jgi:hypothetical protein
MTRILNTNNVSVKTYGQYSDTLAIIKELKKLGIIKSVAKAKGKSKPKLMDEIKQESDLMSSVTYSKTEPNLFALRQIEPGMTQQQIEDTQQRNAAGVAALRAEVQQQRLEDISKQERLIGGLAGAATQRFEQLQSGLGQIRSQRFGSSYNPVVEQSSFEPDIQEETFTQSLNEGGPEVQPAIQTELFAGGEEEQGIPINPRIVPQERLQIGYGMSPVAAETLGLSPEFIEKTKQASRKKLIRVPQDASDELGLGKIPNKTSSKPSVIKYYQSLIDRLSLRADRDVIASGTRVDYIAEIDAILKGFLGQ